MGAPQRGPPLLPQPGRVTVLNPRSGRPRQAAVDAFRSTCAALLAPCWLCNNPIDYQLERHRHPLRFTVDEAHPLSLGGSALDPSGYRPAHACCNSCRGNRPVTEDVRTACAARYHHHAGRALSRRW
jgi:hypothetical protein